MNKLHYAMFLALTALFVLAGCKKDNSEELPVDETVKSISAKWNISSTASSYISIEFNESLTYIIVSSEEVKSAEGEGAVLFGTYEVVDKSTLKLNGFGTVLLGDVGSQNITFTLRPTGQSSQTITASKSPTTIPASSRTEMICKTWKLDKIEYFGLTVSEKIECEEENAGLTITVLFSAAGTYFVDRSDDEGGLAVWEWKNQEQTQFNYAWGDVLWDGYVEIAELTKTKLVIKEYYGEFGDDPSKYLVYTLVPYASKAGEIIIAGDKLQKQGVNRGVFGIRK